MVCVAFVIISFFHADEVYKLHGGVWQHECPVFALRHRSEDFKRHFYGDLSRFIELSGRQIVLRSYLLSLRKGAQQIMEKKYSVQESSPLVSIEKMILMIRETRDRQIDALLKDTGLMSFLEEQYETFAISSVKKEFLKRDLKELQNTSLDLAHYSSLIKQMKEATLHVELINHPLVLQEFKRIFQKYGF